MSEPTTTREGFKVGQLVYINTYSSGLVPAKIIEFPDDNVRVAVLKVTAQRGGHVYLGKVCGGYRPGAIERFLLTSVVAREWVSVSDGQYRIFEPIGARA